MPLSSNLSPRRSRYTSSAVDLPIHVTVTWRRLDRRPAQFTTADLCDDFDDLVRVAEPLFGDYGGRKTFFGEIETVRVFEDNVLVREALEEEGRGRVLVVDGGGSTRW